MEDMRITKKDVNITFPVQIIAKLDPYQETGKYPKQINPYVVLYRNLEKRLLASDALDRYLEKFQVGANLEITFVETNGKFGYSVVSGAPKDEALSPAAQEAKSFSVPNEPKYQDKGDSDPGPVEPPTPERLIDPAPAGPPVTGDAKWNDINAKKELSIRKGQAVNKAIDSLGRIVDWDEGIQAEVTNRARAIVVVFQELDK